MDQNTILIICKDGEIRIDRRLMKFCRIWDEIFDDETSQITDEYLECEHLLQLYQFYQMHNFDKGTIFTNKPLTNSLQECLDPISCQYFYLVFNWNTDKQQELKKIEELQSQAERFIPLLSLSYKLDCPQLTDNLLTVLALPFLIQNEESLQIFSNEFKIDYIQDAEKMVDYILYFYQQIMIQQENNELFQQL